MEKKEIKKNKRLKNSSGAKRYPWNQKGSQGKINKNISTFKNSRRLDFFEIVSKYIASKCDFPLDSETI